MAAPMPALFVGHGNPLNALARNAYTEGWAAIGSGNVVHNLSLYAWGEHEAQPFDWALRFEQLVRELLRRGDVAPLTGYEDLGSDALLSVPTPDHYLPLLYVLGLRRVDEPVSFPVDGTAGGSISMLAVRVG